jgi:hypothetical protein
MKLVIGLLCLSLSAADVVKEADAKALASIVSFLSSDALEGRETPSMGLTVASEYIASEYRRVGLKASFQEAKVAVRRVVRDGFEVSLSDGTKSVKVPMEGAFWTAGPKIDLSDAPVKAVKMAELRELKTEGIEPVVLIEGPAGPGLQQAVMKLSAAGVKLVILVGIPMALPVQTLEFDDQPKMNLVMLRTTNADAEAMLKSGAALKLTAKIHEAASQPGVARNVIGVLEGSDPKLKDEYVVLTAHYDHLGIRPNNEGDKVYNGANDNASGVASIIESARLISQLPTAPKRSLMLIAFFGEERGLLGSRYLTRHPVVPLKQMVANVNLEQTGRTDSSEGPNVGQLNLTGYHFSTIHKHMEEAGKATDLKIVKHEKFSDPYFNASDNAAFAPVGVPSTTVSVTYAFPDYHQLGDEWEKIDYANMAKVTRAIAQGAYLIADAPERIVWNAEEPKTKAYRDAAEKLLLMK